MSIARRWTKWRRRRLRRWPGGAGKVQIARRSLQLLVLALLFLVPTLSHYDNLRNQRDEVGIAARWDTRLIDGLVEDLEEPQRITQRRRRRAPADGDADRAAATFRRAASASFSVACRRPSSAARHTSPPRQLRRPRPDRRRQLQDPAGAQQRPAGHGLQPLNLSVADSAEPEKNHWLVNETSHRGWDPVSGQADYKKLAARLEKVRAA